MSKGANSSIADLKSETELMDCDRENRKIHGSAICN